MNGQTRAAGLIIIASAFVAASTLCAKALGTGPDALSAFQITWGRYVFGLMGICAMWPIIRPKLTPPKWPHHIVRITCGVAGVNAMFAAAAVIPLADVTAMSFTNPIFAMLIAIPVLKEKIGPIRWATAAFALLGAFLLIRPGTSAFQPAALLALLAAVLFGLEVVILKMLAGKEGPFQIIFIANAAGTLLASLSIFFVWQMPTTPQWMFLAATGLLMVTAQAFYTNAMRLGDASFVLPFSYATLLFAAFYDFVLFDVIPVPLSFIGGGIIVLSGIILAWREGRVVRN